MKVLSILTGLALIAFGVTAHAHAHLQKSSPADHSVITTSPSNLELAFSELAQLTSLSIQKDKEEKQNLTSLPTKAAMKISMALPPLTPGTYQVIWRVLSDDGHMMAGVLHFTLTGEHATDHPAQH
jgi:methionine-rich copper-binding protein CopC